MDKQALSPEHLLLAANTAVSKNKVVAKILQDSQRGVGPKLDQDQETSLIAKGRKYFNQQHRFANAAITDKDLAASLSSNPQQNYAQRSIIGNMNKIARRSASYIRDAFEALKAKPIVQKGIAAAQANPRYNKVHDAYRSAKYEYIKQVRNPASPLNKVKNDVSSINHVTSALAAGLGAAGVAVTAGKAIGRGVKALSRPRYPDTIVGKLQTLGFGMRKSSPVTARILEKHPRAVIGTGAVAGGLAVGSMFNKKDN